MKIYTFYCVAKDVSDVYEIEVVANTDKEALKIYKLYCRQNNFLGHQQARVDGREVIISLTKVS